MTGSTPSFSDLGLRPVVVHALRSMGIATPFPIQAAAIRDAIAGRDILGRAPTGSGKTFAFGLPLLHRLSGAASRPRYPRGLVLVPTRELALQIDRALEEPALASGLRIVSVVGGVPIKRQTDRLARGGDIVVATPGRLEDLVSAGHLHLSDVSVTVVDEADRMADLGFLPQVTALLNRTPDTGQTMLFSATLDNDVDALVRGHLRDPAVHRSEPAVVEAAEAQHYFFRVTPQDKTSVAVAIAARDGKTVLFLRTKHAVDRFTDSLLAVGVRAAALHGDKTQAHRTRTLTAFSDGSVPVLVATDVVARGIDIDDVSLVVHVDPPADAKDYTHRAGRTARAGRGGTVVTLVTQDQVHHITALAAEAGVDVSLTDVTSADVFSPDVPFDAASRRRTEQRGHLVQRVTGARRPPGNPASAPPRAEPAASTSVTPDRRGNGGRGRVERGNRRRPDRRGTSETARGRQHRPKRS